VAVALVVVVVGSSGGLYCTGGGTGGGLVALVVNEMCRAIWGCVFKGLKWGA